MKDKDIGAIKVTGQKYKQVCCTAVQPSLFNSEGCTAVYIMCSALTD